MKEPTPTENMKEALIEIVAYHSTWPEKFQRERQALEAVLAPWLVGSIEHVGSTAIPGLVAKPIIDIMVGVESLEASRDAIPAAESLQYNYWPYKAEVMHWFCKPAPNYRTHHLHLVPYGSRLWKARLYFRDSLRANDLLAEEYAALKQALAQKYRHNREAYTEGKSGFVLSVLASQGVNPESAEV